MNASAADIDTIFWEAAQLPAGPERDDYLGRACGDDADLRRRVDKLLNVRPRLDRFLEAPFAGPAPEPPAPGEAPGTVIGPYKLVEQIGEGGMGLVFLAEQSHPVRRLVALKVLKPGLDTRHVLARFDAERQALALMDHPHIAKVFDAGTASSGRPYFVMELVRGVPITDFCDQHRLDPRRRLALFADVCRAVQHAHTKGIIHRDLKPSNVLVTLHDTVPVPKVIDFGIAKATGERLTERTLVTQFSQVIGTPLYMSPEQAQMNGLDVDTRSDVYALGVLLYELLTGATPFDPARLRSAGYDETRRILREEEPPRPSRQVATLGTAAAATVAERRGVDARQFGRQLRGDLDWIVMKALEKDRARRYESASALAADVERYLAGEAVEARPPSAAYRLRKFAGRNKASLAAASMVAATLVAATAVSTWQAVTAREAQRQAEAAEQRAATEATIAQAVNVFLQDDLLRQVHSVPQFRDDFGGRSNLTVKEALDRAATKAGERFRDQPLVEAAIRTAIGEAYASLGENSPAVPHLERAVELRKHSLGSDHSETMICSRSLAFVYEWVGRYDDAIALHKRLVEDRASKLGTDHPETLAMLGSLAIAFRKSGQWDVSVPLLEQSVQKSQVMSGPIHPGTLGLKHLLAMNYEDVGRFREAIGLMEDVLKVHESTVGLDDGGTLYVMQTLARAYQRVGKLDRADQVLRQVLMRRRMRIDSLGQIRTAHVLDLLGLNLLLQQQYEAAEQVVREALSIYERERPEHWMCCHLKSVLGSVLLGQQRYEAAEPLLLKGYEGLKQQEVIIIAPYRYRLSEAARRIVSFYDATSQPEKAREWKAKLPPDVTPASPS